MVLRNNAAARILPDCAHRPIPFPLDEIASADVREIVNVVLDSPGGFMILSRQIPLGDSTYMVNVSPVIEPGGETSGAVAVFSDVTELKKLDTAKSMFVSLVAHEVKSPLAATEGWLNLVLSGMLKTDPAEERRMLERALLRVRTLRAMVNELLSLTAIQTGNFSLKRAPVDVAAVAAEVVETQREKAAEQRDIAVEVSDRARGAPRAGRPRRAVHDLRQPRGERGEVLPRRRAGHGAHRAGDGMYVTVSVRDDGIGISPEDCGEGLRRVLPGPQRADGRHPGHRPGPEPREAAHRAARGHGERHLDARRGQRVHRPAAWLS